MVVSHAGALVVDVVLARGSCDLAEPRLLSRWYIREHSSHVGIDPAHRVARCRYHCWYVSVGSEF